MKTREACKQQVHTFSFLEVFSHKTFANVLHLPRPLVSFLLFKENMGCSYILVYSRLRRHFIQIVLHQMIFITVLKRILKNVMIYNIENCPTNN